jgi:hypothetical protein
VNCNCIWGVAGSLERLKPGSCSAAALMLVHMSGYKVMLTTYIISCQARHEGLGIDAIQLSCAGLLLRPQPRLDSLGDSWPAHSHAASCMLDAVTST